MPTNDERREVATRLRSNAKAHPHMGLLLNFAFADKGLNPDGEMEYNVTSYHAALRLADLIEPGPQCPYYSDERHRCSIHDIEPEPEHTCHIVMVSPGEWECSACGGGIDWDSYDEGDLPNCNYCPNCGAKVVEE